MMMMRKRSAQGKAQSLLNRAMRATGLSTKKLLILGGVALLALLGITMSGSVSGRRRLTGSQRAVDRVVSYDATKEWASKPLPKKQEPKLKRKVVTGSRVKLKPDQYRTLFGKLPETVLSKTLWWKVHSKDPMKISIPASVLTEAKQIAKRENVTLQVPEDTVDMKKNRQLIVPRESVGKEFKGKLTSPKAGKMAAALFLYLKSLYGDELTPPACD